MLTVSTVYHRETIKIGYMKRLLEFRDSTFWHLKNHRLAYADRGGQIYVRDLRNRDNLSVDLTKTLLTSKTHKVLGLMDLAGLWILDDGDVLIHTYPAEDPKFAPSVPKSDRGKYPGILTRLRPSEPVSIVWELCGQPMLCGPECIYSRWREHGDALPMFAVGKSKIYEMRHDEPQKYLGSSWVATLVIRRLEEPNGGYTVQHYKHPGFRNWTGCHMILTGDEKFLILKSRREVVSVISTETGDVQRRIGSFHARRSVNVVSTYVVGTSSARFWEYQFRSGPTPGKFKCSMYRNDYDVSSASFVRKFAGTEHKSDFSLGMAYDAEQHTTMLAKNCTDTPMLNKKNPVCQLQGSDEYMTYAIHKWRAHDETFNGTMMAETAPIRIPDPNDGLVRKNICIRRPEQRYELLAEDLPTSRLDYDPESYMGMMDSYFVNYDATRGQLLIFDFWPSW